MSIVRPDGYCLVTAEIFYHRPDHPVLLQQYVWQEYDLAPRLPVLHKFLNFWKTEIHGKLHSVRFASTGIIEPTEIKYYAREHQLN